MPLESSVIRVPSHSSLAAISLSETISALSFALDLTEGAVPGHALRTCLLGMKIAAAAGMSEPEVASLYYALLLKDTGSSSNVSRYSQIVGGDAGGGYEWFGPNKTHASTPRPASPGTGPAREATTAMPEAESRRHENDAEMITRRGERGSMIVRKLGLGRTAATAVRHIDERWDGSGYPDGLAGQDIPLLSRVCAIAQHLDLFGAGSGTGRAIEVLEERSGRWFDPELVRITVALHRGYTLWAQYSPNRGLDHTRRAVMQLDPVSGQSLDATQIDRICEAFADVIDAKSPFTFRHSVGVAEAALDIATVMGLTPSRTQLVRRAALLHDIGKLQVPSAILDKPGGLTTEEWLIIEEHPTVSRRILQRVRSFQELAIIAGQHHEKLDGSGYPNGLPGRDLMLESRIVAVADVFGALREDRPYRGSLEVDQILSILRAKSPHQLDRDCIEALSSVHRLGVGSRSRQPS